MKTIFATVALCLPLLASAQTCTSTLSPGANIASALSSASPGNVICLNNGSYGSVTISSIRPSGRVILRAVNQYGASLSFSSFQRSTNLTFKNLDIDGLAMNELDLTEGPYNSNITFHGNRFDSTTPILLYWAYGALNSNIVLSGNVIQPAYNPDEGGNEGYITTYRGGTYSEQPMGLTIAHNIFDGTGSCADGINVNYTGNAITIGPGNIFRNWRQGACGRHVDSIQHNYGSSTIVGNYFHTSTIAIGIYDGGYDMVIRDNVFDGNVDNTYNLQLGAIDGMLMTHNTFRTAKLGIGSKTGPDNNMSWVIENNILYDNTLMDSGSGGNGDGCGTGCIKRYNVVDSTSFLVTTGGTGETNRINGTPTFSGSLTTPPANTSTAWGQWRLSVGSPGKAASNDSPARDVGTNYFNPSAPTVN